METQSGKISPRPPRFIEAIVRRTLPPASREHVIGDMREEYVSRLGYLRDLYQTIPFILAERIRVWLSTPPVDSFQTQTLISRRFRLILAATLIPLFLLLNAPDTAPGPHPEPVLLLIGALVTVHWLRQTPAWHACARVLSGTLLAVQAGILFFLTWVPGAAVPPGLARATVFVLLLGILVFWIHNKNPFSERK